jgi:hypothetical protein
MDRGSLEKLYRLPVGRGVPTATAHLFSLARDRTFCNICYENQKRRYISGFPAQSEAVGRKRKAADCDSGEARNAVAV